MSTFLAAVAAAVACAALAVPAQASPSLLSFMMDDDLLLYDTYGTREFSVGYMRRAGAEGLRVTVSWKFVSGEERGRPRRQPAKLRGRRAEDPRSYRSDIWDRFDDVVRLARNNGMFVLFNVTGPGPVWAHGRAPLRRRFDQPAWKPRVADFHRFVKAVGRRYSGSYSDDNQDHAPLPRVVLWSVWNEVNQPASLSPQLEYSPRLRRQVPVAPIIYRELYYAATRALRETGHAEDVIMMGETAPLGAVRNTPRVHLWPKLFIRELFCLRPNLRPYRGLEARVRRCDALRRNGRFLVKAWAHHPYTQRNPPTRRDRDRDSINMANVHELPALLDAIADRTGLIPRGLPVALTEAGWETLPPDPTRGVPVARQAEYINVMQRIAYDNPRVIIDTQFVLRDVRPRARFRGRPQQYWATWQSGLLYADGRPKPAFQAYIMPFDMPRRQGRRRAWGQVRFLPNFGEHDVYLQFRPAGSQRWQYGAGPIRVTNPLGYWEADVEIPGPGVWQALVVVQDQAVYSREVSVDA